MKKAKCFQFLYPVTSLCLGKAEHVGDITVNAIVYQYSGGTLHRDSADQQVTVDFDSMIWQGSNVRKLIQCLAEDVYSEITEAARQHGVERFEITESATA